jgi:hypothetical protein
MAGSPADAISKAVERSKQLLFPFKVERWFALGFTAFLAQCSEGGGSSFNLPTGLPSGSSPSSSSSGGSGGLRESFDEAVSAFHAEAALYVSLGVAALLVMAGVWLLILWFSSRAKLMLVESVVWERVDVSAQWTRAAELGWSLFKFRAALSLTAWLLFLLCAGAGFAVALPAFLAGELWGPRAWAAYATWSLGALLVGLPAAIVSLLLDDFVVPLMVVRNTRVKDAWAACRSEVLAGNVGGLVLFYLLRMVLGVAIAMVTSILTCVTCCMTVIPYVGTVILLPVFVFSRAYPLYYLEQLGIAVFPRAEPQWAAYEQWRFPT